MEKATHKFLIAVPPDAQPELLRAASEYAGCEVGGVSEAIYLALQSFAGIQPRKRGAQPGNRNQRGGSPITAEASGNQAATGGSPGAEPAATGGDTCAEAETDDREGQKSDGGEEEREGSAPRACISANSEKPQQIFNSNQTGKGSASAVEKREIPWG